MLIYIYTCQNTTLLHVAAQLMLFLKLYVHLQEQHLIKIRGGE